MFSSSHACYTTLQLLVLTSQNIAGGKKKVWASKEKKVLGKEGTSEWMLRKYLTTISAVVVTLVSL